MRLFVALPLPYAIKEYLLTLQKAVGNADAKINWVAKKNLHLTLKFFGTIPEHKLDTLRAALRTIRFPPIKTHLTSFGVFPHTHDPHVLWVGLTPEEPLSALQSLIDQETLSYGKQEQSFTTHITLGRIKTIKHLPPFLNTINAIRVEPRPLSFTSFLLYQSTLRTTGPQYTLLEDYTLQP